MAMDDNPFARHTVWPRPPQTPFRIGPLPKAPADSPPSTIADEPPPQQVTPLFVRPAEPARPFFGVDTVVASARPESPPQPPEPPATAPPSAEVAPPRAPEPAVVELEPLVVTPVGLQRRATRSKGRSRLPAVAATVVGVGGLAGLAVLFARNNAAPPSAPVPTTAPAAIAAPTPVVTAPPPAAPGPKAASRPRVAAVTAPAATARPTVRAAAPPSGRHLASDASTATEEAITAPLLALPPPQPPAPAVQPASTPPAAPYRPPPAPDPSAPVSTERPY
jgi:Meckel syndrome type 1 protein